MRQSAAGLAPRRAPMMSARPLNTIAIGYTVFPIVLCCFPFCKREQQDLGLWCFALIDKLSQRGVELYAQHRFLCFRRTSFWRESFTAVPPATLSSRGREEAPCFGGYPPACPH